MKQVGLALALALAGVNMNVSEAQAPRLDVDAQLPSDAELTLHAPMGLFVASMSAMSALAVSLSVLAVSHCPADGTCDSLTRQTNGTFAGTIAAASLALASLVWVIARSVKRRNARAALQALSVFGGGLRF